MEQPAVAAATEAIESLSVSHTETAESSNPNSNHELSLEQRFQIIRSIGEECIQDEELRNLLAKKPEPICYDGFEPSGRMHIAQMEEEGRFAQELYAESLQLSKLQLRPTSADDQKNKLTDCDDFNLDVSSWDGFDDNLHNSSDLDREWQRRHDQFHTIGYRDGLIAGKEASAQEGFNIGFKQSVLAGYSWGAVRGVTSALAYLPDQLKEKLVETLEKRNEFQGLYESVHSLSTTDALRLFNEDIKAKEASEQSEHVEVSPQAAGLLEKTSDGSQLGNYLGQLESLICESPAIGIHLPKLE